MDENLMAVILALIASSGFWSLFTAIYNNRRDKKFALESDRQNEKDMLKGLAHDRLTFLGAKYIERGYITPDEYENFYTYLYKPYKALGGNGSVEHLMENVNKLPLHD